MSLMAMVLRIPNCILQHHIVITEMIHSHCAALVELLIAKEQLLLKYLIWFFFLESVHFQHHNLEKSRWLQSIVE